MVKSVIDSGTQDNTRGGVLGTLIMIMIWLWGMALRIIQGGGMRDIVSGQGMVENIHLSMNNLT